MELQQQSSLHRNGDHERSNNGKKRASSMLKYRFGIPSSKDGTKPSKLNIAMVGKAFCDRTSSQGISQVYSAPRGSKKLCWMILAVMAIVMLAVHLYFLIFHFVQFETTTEVSVFSSRLLDFPAVTVCNNNMIKRDIGIGGATGYPRKVKNSDYSSSNDDDYLVLNNADLGHQRDDLIVNASFDNYPIDVDEFTLTMNTRFGNCFTFNQNSNKKSRRALPGYGLQMVLNIERYAYQIDPPTEWVGAIVKIHHPDVEAIPEESAIAVSPNTLNRLAVKETMLTRLGGVYGECLGYEDKKPETYYSGNYTKQNCESTCFQRAVIGKCCCYLQVVNRDLSEFDPTWTPSPEDKRSGLSDWNVCKRDDVGVCSDSDTCLKKVLDTYYDGTLDCDECLDLCSETKYDVLTVSTEWPSEEFAKLMEDRFRRENPILYSHLTTSSSKPIIERNFLKVQIYFDSLTTTQIKEIPETSNFEFISELGGTFGLWIGWTVLTVFEFVELFMDIVMLRFVNKPGNIVAAGAVRRRQ